MNTLERIIFNQHSSPIITVEHGESLVLFDVMDEGKYYEIFLDVNVDRINSKHDPALVITQGSDVIFQVNIQDQSLPSYYALVKTLKFISTGNPLEIKFSYKAVTDDSDDKLIVYKAIVDLLKHDDIEIQIN